MPIQISDKAVEQLRKLEVGEEKFLRISVVPGGCSGMTYSACIDSNSTDEDEVVHQVEDVRVVADLGSVVFLDGLEIDYSDDLVRSGFRFRNPRARKSCGCGASFAT